MINSHLRYFLIFLSILAPGPSRAQTTLSGHPEPAAFRPHSAGPAQARLHVAAGPSFALATSQIEDRQSSIENSFLASGQADKALIGFVNRTKADPNDAEAHYLLCRTYLAIEDWNRAADSCERAVELEPANSLYQLWAGRAVGERAGHSNPLTAGRLARKVRTYFERAVELNKQRVDARRDLAEFYIEAPAMMGGGKDKAARVADEVQRYDLPAAEWIRARIAEKSGSPSEAENHYRAAITASKDPAHPWLDLAGFFRRTKRLDDMEEAISTAVAAAPRDPEVLFDAANLLHRAGRNFPGAIQYLKTYLDSGKPSADVPLFRAHHLLGMLLEKQGKQLQRRHGTDSAEHHFRAALTLASQYKPSQDALKRLSK